MKKERRPLDIFNLSFLDIISCGFGAIILLLVISKVSEPIVLEKVSVDLSGTVRKLELQIHELRGKTKILNRELAEKQNQLSQYDEKIARLQGDLSTIKGQFKTAATEMAAKTTIKKQLLTARQNLTEEMQRLQARAMPETFNSVIGGIPVDSEYIIFVIDTSGSMQRWAWPLVQKKMAEILKIYPHVQGIQVLNDMGDYMFSQYAGRWIPDTPARRRSILSRLSNWAPFSNSSPVEGVTSAIRRFHAADKRISIYIFGDDFSRGAIQDVVETINHINQDMKDGKKRVRIHAVGFPVLFKQASAGLNVAKFSALMRKLAEDNNGSFVGLTRLE
jgi:hypothetical protein